MKASNPGSIRVILILTIRLRKGMKTVGIAGMLRIPAIKIRWSTHIFSYETVSSRTKDTAHVPEDIKDSYTETTEGLTAP